MPVRRRKSKSARDTVFSWEGILGSEFDLFGDARRAGIKLDEHDRPTRADAEDAWRRLGAQYLETADRSVPCWALQEFGLPPGAIGVGR